MWFLQLLIISFVTSAIECNSDKEPSQGYDYWKTKELYPRHQKAFSNEKGTQNLYGDTENPIQYQYSQYDLNDRYSQYEDYHQEIERPKKVSKAVSKGLKKINDRTFDLFRQNGNLLGLTPQSLVGLFLTTIAFGGLAVLVSNDLVFPNKQPTTATQLQNAATAAVRPLAPTVNVAAPAAVAPIPDPCTGLASCTGTTDRCVNGVCLCGANPPCAGNSDTCTAGDCRCGINKACGPPLSNTCSNSICVCGGGVSPCTAGSTTPSCLENSAGSPIPAVTSTMATCQCSGNSCVAGRPTTALAATQNANPFCGTLESQTGTANMVAIGVCGGCQTTPGGGGIVSACNNVALAPACLPFLGTTSCGFGSNICCASGDCVAQDRSNANAQPPNVGMGTGNTCIL